LFGLNNLTKLIVTSAAAGLTGALLTLLVLRIGPSATSANSAEEVYDRMSATAFCRTEWGTSEPSFYAEMDLVNTRMHQGMTPRR
jgi:hypothetical protein